MEDMDTPKEEELSDFCRVRMQKFSEISLNLFLLEMRNQDKESNGKLHFSTINSLIQKSELPITPCLAVLQDPSGCIVTVTDPF